MGVQYCLKWKQFSENISESLRDLRDDSDFFNVTLAFDDEKYIEANKMVLSACSTMLKSVLKRSKQPHTFIYLSGLSSSTISSLMDFMYNGEVSVPQEDLDGFLAAANRLKIKGLSNGLEKAEDNKDNFLPKEEENIEKVDTMVDNFVVSENLNEETIEPQSFVDHTVTKDETFGASEFLVDGDNSEGNFSYIGHNFECQVCGKILLSQSKLNVHMDHYHPQDGVSHPCHYCEKSFGTKNARNVHKFRNHKNKME